MSRGKTIGKTARQASREALQVVYEARAAKHNQAKRRDARKGEDRRDGRALGESVRLAWQAFPADLAEATGDPLAAMHPEQAAAVYGLATAKRRRVALRKLAGAVFGDAFSSAVEMAQRLRDDVEVARRADFDIPVWHDLDGPIPATSARSNRIAAEMALALLATRGEFIGAGPTPFAEAADLVRLAMTKRGDPSYAIGDTGQRLRVRPVHNALVPMPDALGTYLPSTGATVPDTAYWRRRLADGDVAVF